MRVVERICLYLVVAYAALTLLDRARADEEPAAGSKSKPVAPAPAAVTTSEINLVNADGTLVVRMYARASGGGAIDVFNKAGKLATRLYARNDHDGELQLNDENGELRSNIGGNDTGGYANIYNRKGDLAVYAGGDSEADAGYVAVWGPKEVKAAEISVNKFGGAFAARNVATNKRVTSLGTAPDTGTGVLAIASKEGKAGVGAYVTEDGGQLMALNGAGKRAAFLGVSADPAGNGLIYVANKSGQRIVESGANAGGGGYMSVRNSVDKRVLFLGATTGKAADDGVVEVQRKSGDLGVVLRAYEAASSVRIYDKDEKVIKQLR